MSESMKRWSTAIPSIALLVTLCGIGAKAVWLLSDMSAEMRHIRVKVDGFEKVADRVNILERRTDVLEERVIGQRNRKSEVMLAEPN